MAKKSDHFADARKYAGKNTAEQMGGGKPSDMGVPVVRPFVMSPNGRTFNEAGWGRKKK